MFENRSQILNLSRRISATFGLHEDSVHHKMVFQHSVVYALRRLSAAGVVEKIKHYVPRSQFKAIGEYRMEITQSAYLLLNLRALAVHLCHYGKDKPLKQLAEHYEVCRDDALMLMRVLPNLQATCKFDEKVVRRVTNIGLIQRRLSQIVPEIQRYCRGFIRKKLSFVVKSHNIETSDLETELLCKAISTYYWSTIDGKSKLHTLNSLRTSCHNHGTNMIQYFTYQKRARMVNCNGQFLLTEMSESQLGLGEGQSYTDLSVSATPDHSEHLILQVSVGKLMVKYSNSSKRLNFLRLMMGSVDDRFSHWLRSVKNIRVSNDVLYDNLMRSKGLHRYLKLVSEFLEVSEANVHKFLSQLKQDLMAVNSASA